MTQQDISERQRRFAALTTWRECEKVLDSGIFSTQGVGSPLFQAAVVQTLICLNDLLQKASADNARVNFVEHVEVGAKVKDVTDLIRECRNAACHVGSSLNDVDFGRFRFGVAAGKATLIQVVDGPAFANEFDDDIAVFYGNLRLYMSRHVVRAWREVGQALRIAEQS